MAREYLGPSRHQLLRDVAEYGVSTHPTGHRQGGVNRAGRYVLNEKCHHGADCAEYDLDKFRFQLGSFLI